MCSRFFCGFLVFCLHPNVWPRLYIELCWMQKWFLEPAISSAFFKPNQTKWLQLMATISSEQKTPFEEKELDCVASFEANITQN